MIPFNQEIWQRQHFLTNQNDLVCIISTSNHIRIQLCIKQLSKTVRFKIRYTLTRWCEVRSHLQVVYTQWRSHQEAGIVRCWSLDSSLDLPTVWTTGWHARLRWAGYHGNALNATRIVKVIRTIASGKWAKCCYMQYSYTFSEQRLCFVSVSPTNR